MPQTSLTARSMLRDLNGMKTLQIACMFIYFYLFIYLSIFFFIYSIIYGGTQLLLSCQLLNGVIINFNAKLALIEHFMLIYVKTA